MLAECGALPVHRFGSGQYTMKVSLAERASSHFAHTIVSLLYFYGRSVSCISMVGQSLVFLW